MAQEVTYPGYRWVMLLLAWFINFMVGMNHVIVATRAHDLIPQLGLTTSQFYICYTAVAIVPIVMCLVGGTLSDRFGVKWTLGIGAALATAGALLRLTATGFWPFFIWMALLGIGYGVVIPIRAKLVAVWFPPRQVAVATGIYLTGALGTAIALFVGAMFATWQIALIVTGVVMAVGTVAWFILARERPTEVAGVIVKGVPLKEGLAVAAKSKNMWWTSASYIFTIGVIMAWIGGMPHFLETSKGMSPGAASLIPAISVVGFLLGTVFWPVMAEKFGRIKPFYMAGVILTGLTGVLTYYVAPGALCFAFAFLPGFFAGCGPGMIMQLPIHLPEFGPRYAGNAGGLLFSMYHIGSFILLPFMFTPIWNAFGPNWAAWFLAIALIIAAALFLPVLEVGRKAREAREQEMVAAKEA